MRYGLRTLLILLAIGPPIGAPAGTWAWRHYVAWRRQIDNPPYYCNALGAILVDQSRDGPVIMSVRPNSPAKAAGLLPGDIIYSLSCEACGNRAGLDTMLNGKRPGDPIIIQFIRNDQYKATTMIVRSSAAARTD